MLMLTEHGHEAHFITSIGFNDTVPEGVVVHAVLPHTSTHEIKHRLLGQLQEAR